ncbi:family 16 glycosylhydrolase [Alsobacter sp. SYSU M60028]|uniref:Family 16 glycosylhydrolase n=1 Tax=Alsobacter ponti TaxID=2962936 RepID=A0ABT1L7A9_9HYPH|nr:family 16 glycosylhydrolase [Alsobacter ponti]MCP8936956.1 family 16 glycosylhydrolase [Alsobacter ponti]
MSTTVPPRSGMTLSFSDEFDRTTLNGDGYNWMTYFPWGARNQPNLEQSSLFVDTDYVTPTGIMPGINPHQMIADPNEPGDGILAITADLTPADLVDDIGAKYTSGHINSANMFDFRYGYVEMRAQVPFGQGLLSTFYLLRTDTAALGEIDINEHVGQWPKNLFSSVHYWNGQYTAIDKTVREIVTTDLSAGFHTYGVDWQADYITFYVDGQVKGKMVTPESLKAPMYIIADMSVGSNWVGYPDSTTVFPNQYKIDYIKVFQDASAFVPLTVNGTSASETLSGGDGADTISGGLGDDTIMGGQGADTISGGDGADRIIGNIGNDTIVGNGGADTLEGSGGDDLFVIDASDTVYERPTAGFDTVMTSSNTYNPPGNIEGVIFTGVGNFSSVGTPGPGLYIGFDGNDTMNGGTGDDTIRGGLGNDSLTGADGADWLYGGDGNDTMVGGTGADRYIFTTPVSASSDLIRSFRPGEDKIDLRALGLTDWTQIQGKITANASGYAVITSGNETITLENVKPTALSSGDFIQGAADVAQAPTGLKLSNSTVLENSALGTEVGTLIGLDPDPTQAHRYSLVDDAGGLFAISGRRIVVAGALDYETATSHQVTVQITNESGLSTTRVLTIGVGDVLEGNQPPPPPPPPEGVPGGTTIDGTAAADTLTGTTGVDTIIAGGGNDSLVGYAGNDSLDGGSGADTLLGGAGADTMLGYTGFDVASYSSAGGAIQIDMGNGLWGGASGDAAGDRLYGIEGLEGSAYNDLVYAGTGGSRIWGMAGNDRLEGRGGVDSLYGGDGNDLIVGWGGNDSLNGQGGSDTFVFAPGSGKDLVAGFQAGNGLGDVIAFQGQFTSFEQVMAATADVTGGTSPFGSFNGAVITMGADQIFLLNVSKAQLVADDFDFTTYQLTAPPNPPDQGPDPVSQDPQASTGGAVGTNGADSMVGTDAGDTMSGMLGNDSLSGLGGNDSLDGGGGADTLAGGAGADTLSGGAGVDVASYLGASTAIALDMDNAAWAGAKGDAAGDSLIGVESVEGSNFADAILAASSGARLFGMGGDDTLTGRVGNDTIMGGDGNDRILGDGGNDSLNGQAGNDTFVFLAGSGKDLVAGFSAGASVADTIEFHGQFTSLSDVLAHAQQVSNVTSPLGTAFSGTVITAGSDEIWLANVNKTALAANDFVFL